MQGMCVRCSRTGPAVGLHVFLKIETRVATISGRHCLMWHAWALHCGWQAAGRPTSTMTCRPDRAGFKTKLLGLERTRTTGGSATMAMDISSDTASLSAIILECADKAGSSSTGAPRSFTVVSSMPIPKWSPTTCMQIDAVKQGQSQRLLCVAAGKGSQQQRKFLRREAICRGRSKNSCPHYTTAAPARYNGLPWPQRQ